MKDIKIDNLYVFEKKGTESRPAPSSCILKGIKLEIKFNEGNICIMGESGSGKSTLLNAIRGSLPKNLESSGDSIKTSATPRFFTLFQDADLYFSSHNSLYYYLKLAFGQSKWDSLFINKLVQDLQISISLPEKLKKKCTPGTLKFWKRLTKDHLSGGNKQKFMVLLGLLVKPDMLLLDETFTDIDCRSRQNIIKKIFAGDWGVIMVSHNYLLVKALLAQGKISKVYNLEEGSLNPVCWRQDSKIPQWAAGMEKNHQAIKEIISNKKQYRENLEPDKRHRYTLEKIMHSYGKSRVINYLPDTPLFLDRSCNYAITGENGVGKSTLIKVLMKLEPYKGKIAYWGVNGSGSVELAKPDRAAYMERQQLLFQKTGNAIGSGKTVKEFLLSYFKTREREEKWVDIEKYCSGFRLLPGLISKHSFSHLSVGQQRRVMLIRALVLLQEGGCLFIDEAMRGMDISLKRRLVEHLREEPFQVFLISHDRQLIEALCDIEIKMERQEGLTYFETKDLRTKI